MSKELISNIKIPFRSFDIFTYIFPGAIFLFSVVSACYVFDSKLNWTLLHKLKNKLIYYQEWSLIKDSFPWWVETFFIFCAIFACLLMGHFIGALSNFFIDKIWLSKIIKRPYQRLLHLNHSQSYNSAKQWQNIFFSLNFIIIIYWLFCFLSFKFGRGDFYFRFPPIYAILLFAF